MILEAPLAIALMKTLRRSLLQHLPMWQLRINDMLSLTLPTKNHGKLMPMLVNCKQNRLKEVYCLAFCAARQSTWLAETDWALGRPRHGVQAALFPMSRQDTYMHFCHHTWSASGFERPT